MPDGSIRLDMVPTTSSRHITDLVRGQKPSKSANRLTRLDQPQVATVPTHRQALRQRARSRKYPTQQLNAYNQHQSQQLTTSIQRHLNLSSQNQQQPQKQQQPQHQSQQQQYQQQRSQPTPTTSNNRQQQHPQPQPQPPAPTMSTNNTTARKPIYKASNLQPAKPVTAIKPQPALANRPAPADIVSLSSDSENERRVPLPSSSQTQQQPVAMPLPIRQPFRYGCAAGSRTAAPAPAAISTISVKSSSAASSSTTTTDSCADLFVPRRAAEHTAPNAVPLPIPKPFKTIRCLADLEPVATIHSQRNCTELDVRQLTDALDGVRIAAAAAGDGDALGGAALPELRDDDPMFMSDLPTNVVRFGTDVPPAQWPAALQPNSHVQLYVTEVNSPSKFWFHVFDDTKPLDMLMFHIE